MKCYADAPGLSSLRQSGDALLVIPVSEETLHAAEKGCMYDEVERYTDAECEDVFARLFSQGFAGQDVLDEIAPEG